MGIPIPPGGNAPNPAVADPPAPPAKPAPQAPASPAPPPAAPKKAYQSRNWDGKSELEGAVAGGAGIKAPTQAQARREAQKLFNEVNAAKGDAQARIDALRAQREEAGHQLEDVNRRMAELKASKPPGKPEGSDPWVQQMAELQRQQKALENTSRSLTRQIQQIQAQPLTVEGAQVPPGKVGPVGAVVVDNTTGQVFRAVNADGPPPQLAQVLQQQLANLPPGSHPTLPGSHAEVLALNQAILAREARTGRPVTAGELSSFTLDTVWLQGHPDKTQGMAAGNPAERCANCSHITDGVENMPGDAPVRPHESPRGQRVPGSRYAAQDLEAVKGGGAAGAVVGLGFGIVDAVKTGHVHPGKIVASTAIGAGAGMVGAAVQQHATRMVDRIAGKAIERGLGTTARVLGGRLAGAGIAGAVVSAGFATVDQIGKYRRGEVTGSEAVGNVAGEAAVGMGAGLAGAAAGAAIGSVIPIAGTAVGAVIGFAVGCAAGYLADKGLRGLGVDKAVAHAVTATIDAGSKLVHEASAGIKHAASSLWHALGW